MSDSLTPGETPDRQQQPELIERSSASQAIATVAAALIGGPGTVATAHWLNQRRKPKDAPPQEQKK
jgi:hypothetical protein